MTSKFVIEHLEPDMFEWCVLEYTHISEIVGKENLTFTNISKGSEKISSLGKIESKRADKLDFSNACVLDPAAKEELNPKNAREFDHFIFGGILGDYPPQKRTGLGLKNVMAKRMSLGTKQMSTNTAVLVVKMIIDGAKLSEIKFKDNPTLEIENSLEVELPYRYVIGKDGKIILPQGMIEHLKKEETF